MTKKLNPCPFCGGDDAGMIRIKTTLEVLGFLPLCPDCGGAVGLNVDAEFTAFTDFVTEQEAIDAWNTRAERTCTAGQAGYSDGDDGDAGSAGE